MNKIKIGIVGYGNVGRGVEVGLKNHPDMQLVGIFSRRDPKKLDTEAPAYLYDELINFKDKIDVLILCGGSKKDVPVQGPELIQHFNTVDSYDNRALLPEYYEKMNGLSLENEKVSIVATGWDPGMFSYNRLMQEAILPAGDTYTFWGSGASQGHSDAVSDVEGVKKAVQYTVPDEFMLEKILAGEDVEYTEKSAHGREVYAVLNEDADPVKVEDEIKNMPDYFEGYRTNVSFISEEEFDNEHQNMPHGGRVIRRGNTSDEMQSIVEFSLNLNSNPEFTAAVNLAYARAAYRFAKEEKYGAYTVFDIPPYYLTTRLRAEIIREML